MSSTLNEDMKLTERQKEELRKAFRLFDNGKGAISQDDLIAVMRQIGQDPTEEEVLKMIKFADKNGNQLIEFNEFVEMMQSCLPDDDDEEKVAENMFKLFDQNRNGFICSKELRKMMKSMGEKTNHKQISQMMKFADQNGDGHIDYEEFKKMIEELPNGLQRTNEREDTSPLE